MDVHSTFTSGRKLLATASHLGRFLSTWSVCGPTASSIIVELISDSERPSKGGTQHSHINVKVVCHCQSPWKIHADVVSVFSCHCQSPWQILVDVVSLFLQCCSATRAVSAACGQPPRLAMAGSFLFEV